MNTPKTASFEENIDNRIIDQTSQTFRRIILLSILIVFSTIIIQWWIKRRQHRLRHSGKCLLLCGIKNSGKTLLFNRLTTGIEKRPFYSMSTNHGVMTLDDFSSDRLIERVHVIEIPHHIRRHQHDLYAYKTSAKAIIFVIDSTSVEKDIKYVSDYLYNILHEEYFREQRLPLLVFCNKQDLNTNDYDQESIRCLLEEELTKKRKISNNNDIGRLGKETFEFDDVKDIRIEFVEGSALDTRKKFIDKHYENDSENDSASHLLKVHQWIARIWFK
ncbi:unnamed protein product [Adineta steineri]|uniref:Signal recognition particle receptor subunit beta n=1 Tax=Adineta steineri TaxID=433720 RepID=A0A818N9W9_9BILA|nr:unnamed protein product [Adineta steineri]